MIVVVIECPGQFPIIGKIVLQFSKQIDFTGSVTAPIIAEEGVARQAGIAAVHTHRNAPIVRRGYFALIQPAPSELGIIVQLCIHHAV